MAHISLLFPALKCKDKSYDRICEIINKFLGYKQSQIEIFRLVPIINSEDILINENNGNIDSNELAIRVHSSNLSIKNIEKIILQRDKLKDQVLKAKEALKTYMNEVERMKKYICELKDISQGEISEKQK